MKPGAVILFIENAGGGFYKLVEEEAKVCNLKNVFCQNHVNYVNSDLKTEEFRYQSCCETRVSVFIWRKAYTKKIKRSERTHSYGSQNFPASSTFAIQTPRIYDNFLHEETLTYNNKTPVSNTLAESFSKRIDIDHSNIFQEASNTKGGKNTFASNEKNAKAFKNSQGKLSKAQRNRIDIDHSNIFQEDLYTKGGKNTFASNEKNAKAFKNSQGKLSKAQRNKNPVKTTEYVHHEIASLCFSQFHINRETSSDTVPNLKNIKTIQFPRDKSPESPRMPTDMGREVAAQVPHPNFKYLGLTQVSSSTSSTYRWMDRILDVVWQELIGAITENLVQLF